MACGALARPLPVTRWSAKLAVDHAVTDGIAAAAIFVDASADIEARRGHVFIRAGRPADDDTAARFLRAPLDSRPTPLRSVVERG